MEKSSLNAAVTRTTAAKTTAIGEPALRGHPCPPSGCSVFRDEPAPCVSWADTQLRQIVIDERHFRHANSDCTSRPLCKGLLPPGAGSSRPMHSVAGCNGREARAQLPTNLRARDPARTPAVHRVRKREDGFLLPD